MKNAIAIFWNAADRRLRAFWRLLIQLVAFIGLMLCLAPLAILVLNYAVGEEAPSFRSINMTVGAFIQNSSLVLTIVFACILLDRRRINQLGLKLTRRWWLDLAGGFTMGAVLMTSIFLIELSQGWITLEPNESDLKTQFPFYIRWLLAMICVGAGEEIFSRGYQLKNLTEGFKKLGMTWSVVLASVISSSFFALLHAFNPEASIYSALMICLAGLLFCVGRLATGSLAAPIGLHIAWNYFQGGVFGFPVSGNQMPGSIFQIKQSGNPVWTGGEFGPEAGLLGLVAVIVGMIVFAFWPRPEASWKQSVADLNSFERRTPINSAKGDKGT